MRYDVFGRSLYFFFKNCFNFESNMNVMLGCIFCNLMEVKFVLISIVCFCSLCVFIEGDVKNRLFFYNYDNNKIIL